MIMSEAERALRALSKAAYQYAEICSTGSVMRGAALIAAAMCSTAADNVAEHDAACRRAGDAQ